MSNKLQTADLSFLRGKEVIQICFGLYQIQLHFHEDVSIYWEQHFEHTGHEARSADMTKNSTRDTSLLSLLGQTVERVIVTPDNDLTLQFGNKEVLTIYVSGGPFESIQIGAPGIRIIA